MSPEGAGPGRRLRRAGRRRRRGQRRASGAAATLRRLRLAAVRPAHVFALPHAVTVDTSLPGMHQGDRSRQGMFSSVPGMRPSRALWDVGQPPPPRSRHGAGAAEGPQKAGGSRPAR